MFDSRKDIEQHVYSVCMSCFGQLMQIGYTRQYLTSNWPTKSRVYAL